MGVVVGFILTGSGEFYRLCSLGEVFKSVIIDEFAAIVRIKAQKREWIRGLDVFELFQDAGLSLTKHGALLCPFGRDIGGVDGVGEFSGKRSAAMSDGVTLDVSGAFLIPLFGLNGNVFLK